MMQQLKNLTFDSKHYQIILAILNSHSFSRIVGGSVRDNLIGKQNDDIDIATTLLPQQTIEILSAQKIKVIPTGLKFGGVTAVIDQEKFEITTLRKDILTDGRYAIVEFTNDFEADALRRDFTINALSYDVYKGKLYDYCNGFEDLQARKVKFIGNPFTRIAQDYLRILRFFRFSVYYSDHIDDQGLDAVTKHKDNLTTLSRERIKWEMDRLIMADNPIPGLSVMLQHKILDLVFPEIIIDDLINLDKGIKIAKTLKLSLKLATRYAILFSSLQIDRITLNKYKFSNTQAITIIHNLTIKNLFNPVCATSIINKLWLKSKDFEQDILYLLGLGYMEENIITDFFEKIKNEKTPIFPISGKDLQKLVLNKNISKLLKILEDHWIETKFTRSKIELMLIAKHFIKENNLK